MDSISTSLFTMVCAIADCTNTIVHNPSIHFFISFNFSSCKINFLYYPKSQVFFLHP
jgi:hypothetical protein